MLSVLEKGCEGRESGCRWTKSRRSSFKVCLTFFAFRNIFTLPHVKKLFLPGLLSGPGAFQAPFCYRTSIYTLPSAMHARPSLLCFLSCFLIFGEAPQPSSLGQSCQLNVLIGQCPSPDSTRLSDYLMDIFLMLDIMKDCVTHTLISTYTLLHKSCPPHPNCEFLKGRDNGCQSFSLYSQCPSLNAYLLLLDTVDI